jgi:hypothetical protein
VQVASKWTKKVLPNLCFVVREASEEDEESAAADRIGPGSSSSSSSRVTAIAEALETAAAAGCCKLATILTEASALSVKDSIL